MKQYNYPNMRVNRNDRNAALRYACGCGQRRCRRIRHVLENQLIAVVEALKMEDRCNTTEPPATQPLPQ